MPPGKAILLARISEVRDDGDDHGVQNQLTTLRAYAKRIGWRPGPAATHAIVENDTSAYKRRSACVACMQPARECGCTKPKPKRVMRTWRPEFRRGLAMLGGGSADGLLAVDLDRTCRDPRDLEDLIDVVEGSVPGLREDGAGRARPEASPPREARQGGHRPGPGAGQVGDLTQGSEREPGTQAPAGS